MTFTRFLFADYSGAAEHHSTTRSIVLAEASATTDPTVHGRTWSRNDLHAHVERQLLDAPPGERMLFGFDHQYSWPVAMMEHAGFPGSDWDAFLQWLVTGDAAAGRPALDTPSRYATSMNEYVRGSLGQDLFYAPTEKYGVGRDRPRWATAREARLRGCEQLRFPTRDREMGSFACALGGQGQGSVGGQTLCGLSFLYRLRSNEALRRRVAVWPFDGLDLGAEAYHGRHVAVEIYPSGIRPRDQPQNDHNDAIASVLLLATIAQEGLFDEWMSPGAVPEAFHERTRLEGWILGAGKHALPAALDHPTGENGASGQRRERRARHRRAIHTREDTMTAEFPGHLVCTDHYVIWRNANPWIQDSWLRAGELRLGLRNDETSLAGTVHFGPFARLGQPGLRVAAATRAVWRGLTGGEASRAAPVRLRVNSLGWLPPIETGGA